MTGDKLSVDDLIHLKFAKNEQGEYVDPVTYKVFTNNSHIVALKPTGNVFAFDTVERLNIKAKTWRDLVNDEVFTRKDIITLQDPHNLEQRNLSGFKFIKEGANARTPEQERSRSAGVNSSALGNASRLIKTEAAEHPKVEVGKYLAQTQAQPPSKVAADQQTNTRNGAPKATAVGPTAKHTTGRAAASLTSTGLTPHTSNALASLSHDVHLLRPRKLKQNGYATLITTHGSLTLELDPFHSPKAVWNFITLSKRSIYDNVPFHRNIPGFMLQGGDPSGTGKGGQSAFEKGAPFEDEWPNAPQKGFEGKGILAMANKGKNTNTSQFFITYRSAPHLNRKHTIFGRVVFEGDNEATLKRIEELGTKDGKSKEEVRIESVNVFVDPFEEFKKQELEAQEGQKGREEDERVTWTGKRVREDGTIEGADVGQYMLPTQRNGQKEVIEEWETAPEEPLKKKSKAKGGFGNFDSW